MSSAAHAVTALAAAFLFAAPASAQWVTYTNETPTRLVADPVVGTADVEERNYSAGDVDHDGDMDLVVARKIPWTFPGGRRDVLLLNERGVLVDRTAQFAVDSDIPGGQGLLDATNDRKAILVDVDNDGWLDIVTATMLADGQPKHIGHPRVYHNKGAPGGVWQGFRHEDARFPQLVTVTGLTNQNPRFADVVATDVTGDGYVDLYFSDFDTADQGPSENPANDFNSRLLINNGAGFFTDETLTRMGGSWSGPMLSTSFGAMAWIADINGDGFRDIVRVNTLGAVPQHVGVIYQNPGQPGYFSAYDIVYTVTPYNLSIADLNDDGRIDLIIEDDGQDRVAINAGNGADGFANFTTSALGPASDGFGGDVVIADLDNDGWDDFIVTDVDTDVAGCNRITQFYHNVGGTSFPPDAGNIPDAMRKGVHDVAAVDINGDCRVDLVVGRCTSTEVWINAAPGGSACPTVPPCPADLSGDGAVTGLDLAALLAGWGTCGIDCPADFNRDGLVSGLDLASLLAAWGPCPR